MIRTNESCSKGKRDGKWKDEKGDPTSIDSFDEV